MKKKYLISFLVFLLIIFSPIFVLYLLEDKNINYLNSVPASIMKKFNQESDNILINLIYSKYNETKYNVKSVDEFQHSVIEKEIQGINVINETLIKLKELEEIGLLKNDFFVYISYNDQVITRTNNFYGENFNYSNKKLFLSNDNYENAFMSFEVENITGKIIGFKILKEYVVYNKDILKNYINYLDLNSENWIFESDEIVSKSKNIKIKLENINNFISISLVPYS